MFFFFPVRTSYAVTFRLAERWLRWLREARIGGLIYSVTRAYAAWLATWHDIPLDPDGTPQTFNWIQMEHRRAHNHYYCTSYCGP